MSWRENLGRNPSNAELRMRLLFQREGLANGMFTDTPICLLQTIPDFFWPYKKLTVYLDGAEVHSGLRAEERDERINILLEKRGYTTFRFTYKPPMPQKMEQTILQTVRDFYYSRSS